MQTMRILVVDDQPSTTALVSLILTRCGYEVRAENFPARALAAALAFKPHLILLDVDMPGKDGGEVAHDIHAQPQLADVPIIFLTSLVSGAEAGKGPVNRGGMLFLAKPADPAVLKAAVEECLRDRGAHAPRTGMAA
ncbi:MAG: response regulator [Chthoniobacteraceae bacterium]